MEIGLKGRKDIVVDQSMLASSMGSGLVDVFATPMMIAFMENVCAATVAQEIGAENVTVGTFVQVSHMAATPLGMKATFHCELTAIEGRKLTFAVSAFDEKEKIGEGVHERFIVNKEKFQSRILAKLENNQ